VFRRALGGVRRSVVNHVIYIYILKSLISIEKLLDRIIFK
jgi:hypothetical protein